MEEISHYGPSLGVRFYGKHVYAASGPYIEKYEYHSGKLLNRCQIFVKNKLHGFSIHESGFFLAFGARSIAIVKLQEIDSEKNLVAREFLASEWVINGEFSFAGDAVYLLTCYNKVIICRLDSTVIEIKSVFGERSILYSGSIKVFSASKVYVNAGTVMGGIFIWDLISETEIHNLQGHEGSIFYVTLSNSGKFVATCSDDRSIRLWDLKSGKELSIGWGHTARIWNLKFFDNDAKLISASEDCTCRVWDLVSNGDTTIELTQRNIYEVHQIKNIWGVDVNEKEMIAVTSGNDGRIKITDLQPTSRYGNEQSSFSLSEIAHLSGIEIEKKEAIKGFEWFAFGLIAITSLGKIILYNRHTQKWSLVMTDSRVGSYSITNGIYNSNIVVFTNNKCEILLISFDNEGNLLLSEYYHMYQLCKTTNAMVKEYDANTFFLTLESPNPKDKFLCLRFDNTSLEIIHKYEFTKPDNFVSSCLEIYGNYLLIGSRFSSIGIFDMNNVDKLPPVVRKINPGDTTTSIKFIEVKNKLPIFSVTNRDGFYNFIHFDFDNLLETENSWNVIHSNKVAKGFLEGAFLDEHQNYITYGFKSSLFYIYNESNSYEMASQVCGGAHRQWKLCEDNGDFILVYIKAFELFIRRINKPVFPEVLRNGLHGREIRDISILKEKPYKSGYLFCSASEDTTVRLSHVNSQSGEIINYWLERQHVSGLQRCKFINDHYMVSCSAREELFLWDIDQESLARSYITVRQKLPTSSDNPDLRIMDFDVKFLENSDNFILTTVYSDSVIKVWFYNHIQNKFQLIIYGRYETCCVLNVSLNVLDKSLLLIITPTDGSIVVYNITEHVPFEVGNNKVFLIDNGLGISLIQLPMFALKFRVHQSGIKTLATLSENNFKAIKIFTGGEDNAVGMSILNFDDESKKLNGTILSFIPDAAASTVTSINLFNENKNILVASVDQNVKSWSMVSNKLELLESKYSTVADTGSLDSVALEDGSTLALIGGIGLSVWKISN